MCVCVCVYVHVCVRACVRACVRVCVREREREREREGVCVCVRDCIRCCLVLVLFWFCVVCFCPIYFGRRLKKSYSSIPVQNIPYHYMEKQIFFSPPVLYPGNTTVI